MKKVENWLIILIVSGSFLSSFKPVWDPDTFWHLAFGKFIVENKTLPFKEPFAFDCEEKEIVDLSYLPHIILYLAFKLGKYRAIEILPSLFSSISIIFLISAIKRLKINILSFSIYFLLFFNVFVARFKPRPESFSLLIFSILLNILINYIKGSKIPLFYYLLLFLLWAQVHQSWIYALLIIPFFILYSNWERGNKLLLSSFFLYYFLPILLLMINPYGLRPFLFPFKSFLLMKKFSNLTIEEWKKPTLDFTTIPFLIFCILVVIYHLFLFLKDKKEIWILFMVLVQIILLFSWVRYSTFAFITLSISGAKLFDFLIDKLEKLKVVLTFLLLFLLLIPNLFVIEYEKSEEYILKNYPDKEVEFLMENKIGGNVLHTYIAGGFIEFKGERLKTFFDGRFFDFLERAEKYENAKVDVEKFKIFIKEYPFEIAIMPYSKAQILKKEENEKRNFYSLVFDEKEWAPVFYGPYGIVFLKRLEKYEKIIYEYEYKILFPYDAFSLRKGLYEEERKEILFRELKRAKDGGAGFLND